MPGAKVGKRYRQPLAEKSGLLADANWLADHDIDPATGQKKSQRVVTIWELCKVCADQMYGGPRCYEHNPTPEMRELNSKANLIQARWWDATPSGTASTDD